MTNLFFFPFEYLQCKQVMYQFALIILHKIEKFKPSELCSMFGMCDEEMAMKIKVKV